MGYVVALVGYTGIIRPFRILQGVSFRWGIFKAMAPCGHLNAALSSNLNNTCFGMKGRRPSYPIDMAILAVSIRLGSAGPGVRNRNMHGLASANA